MKYAIHITAAAEQDMVNASDYIEFILKNPQAADDLLDEANLKINTLSAFPCKLALVDDPLLASWGIRFTRVRNYLAFYVVSEEMHLVTIIRFLYGKSNWKFLLKSGFSLI
ncbi:MAG: type II toxin-antitoxin system RelE/ParE family toxin [Blautia sp.]|nr:type II toxin-antitoxin system RelE/ParE family toxin [Blautia sp.]